jgi:predicted Zn-dependent protease
MSKRISTLWLLPVILAGCQTVPSTPFQSMPDRAGLSQQETGIWHDAEDLDQALEKSGAIYPDAAVTQYVQRVMDRLYPEFNGRIHVLVLRTSTLNAFAMPNGRVYLHLGMLARFDNEAELATVLAHEGIHFTNRHSLKQHENIKITAGLLQVTALTVPIAGLVGMPIASSAIYGFSRDLEREADTVGYQRLVRAGYDPSQASKTFEHLAAEVKALEINEPFFFASHPQLMERIESFQKLNNNAPHQGGYLGAEEYRAAMRGVKLASLESDLARQRYKSVLLVLGNDAARRQYPPEANYYLGEAYRQRSSEGDDARAERAYRDTIEAAPQFAPPYRALGIYHMKKKNSSTARAYLKRYLALAPNAPDRAYVEAYYTQLSQEAQ